MARVSVTTMVGAVLVLAAGGVGYAGWQMSQRETPLAVEQLGAPTVRLTETYATAGGTCPGFTTLVPATMRSTTADHATAMLTSDEALLLTCFGTTSEVGTLDDIVDDRRTHGVGGEMPLSVPPVQVRSPFGDSVRFEYVIGARTLTEWLVERDGSIAAVGYLHDGSATQRAAVEAVMAAWAWS